MAFLCNTVVATGRHAIIEVLDVLGYDSAKPGQNGLGSTFRYKKNILTRFWLSFFLHELILTYLDHVRQKNPYNTLRRLQNLRLAICCVLIHKNRLPLLNTLTQLQLLEEYNAGGIVKLRYLT